MSDVRNVKKKKKKNWEIAEFVLEITFREEHPNLKSRASLPNKATVAVKSKNIAITSLK